VTHDATKFTTLVCDDEPDAREGIVELLRRDDEIELVGEARNGAEAAAAIERHAPDLVFLDIQMPKLDGLGVVSHVATGQRSPVFVFVTAYDEYALKAFEVHALDYLLKPFSDGRFSEALTAAKARVRERRACELGLEIAALLRPWEAPASSGDAESSGAGSTTNLEFGRGYLEHFMVRLGGKVTLLRVADIDWIEADDYYAKLHVAGRTYLIRETMQELESKLDPRKFVRVHRSAIVQIDRLRTLEPYIKGSHVLTLRDGTRLALSRGRRLAFEAAIGGRV
jgi:two-component system, LytTR family, response regulator